MLTPMAAARSRASRRNQRRSRSGTRALRLTLGTVSAGAAVAMEGATRLAIEAFLLFGIAFVVLLGLAWRNGSFRRRGAGELDPRAFPQIQPGQLPGQSIRDPRANLDTGDRLGRR